MPEVSVPAESTSPRWVDQRWFIRSLEILPGAVTWACLILPVVLSIFLPVVVAYFIIAFDLYWLFKALRLSFNLIRGYGRLHWSEQVDWNERLEWLKQPEQYLGEYEDRIARAVSAHSHWWNRRDTDFRELIKVRAELQLIVEQKAVILNPAELVNVVILATYNESRQVLESSIRSLTEVPYPGQQLMLVVAYEERGGAGVEQTVNELVTRYGKHFRYCTAIKHPDGIAGEVRGKGGNITFAGRELAQYVTEQGIDPNNVIVTTFDSDHRAGKYYFSLLSYLYASDPNRTRKSFQPIPMFYNNIWDAPAPMRVIATGNSFWLLMETMRPHRLRNFAAHAQSLAALLKTDFWSTNTIVEDGHQYWRTYFAYEGDHQVVPVYAPVYQDAVLAETYTKTLKAQFLQLRRWAWGVSDFPFVVRECIRHTRIPWGTKIVQIGRLFEGHFSWATASLLISFVAWLPLYLNHTFSQEVLAHQLPVITSGIMRIALLGALVTVWISLISLPPRPPRYRRYKTGLMVIQWVLLPVTSIVFGSLAAIVAQTRLMFGRYLEFDVTVKARRS
jgi:hypothetical protein